MLLKKKVLGPTILFGGPDAVVLRHLYKDSLLRLRCPWKSWRRYNTSRNRLSTDREGLSDSLHGPGAGLVLQSRPMRRMIQQMMSPTRGRLRGWKTWLIILLVSRWSPAAQPLH